MPSTYEPGEKFVRVLKLYQLLCGTRTGLTTAQLAGELEVTVRSVQRYLATLRNAVGIDIEEKGGRLRVGQRSRLPAMQLDQYQAAAVLMAVRLLHQMRPHQDPALIGALAQLATALRLPVVARFLETTIVAIEARQPNPTRLQVERTIVEAFVQSRAWQRSRIQTPREGSPAETSIHPYFLEPRPWGIWHGEGQVEVVLHFAPQAAPRRAATARGAAPSRRRRGTRGRPVAPRQAEDEAAAAHPHHLSMAWGVDARPRIRIASAIPGTW